MIQYSFRFLLFILKDDANSQRMKMSLNVYNKNIHRFVCFGYFVHFVKLKNLPPYERPLRLIRKLYSHISIDGVVEINNIQSYSIYSIDKLLIKFNRGIQENNEEELNLLLFSKIYARKNI